MVFMVVAVPIVLVCFFLFPRRTLIALAAVVCLGAVVGLYLYLKQSDGQNAASLVTGTSSGIEGCVDPARPVSVQLSNGSDRQVNVVRFRLIAKRPGFSTETYSDYFTSDKIIEPHAVFARCWALNPYRGLETLPGKPLPGDFVWSVDISSVEFADNE
jgi:hypothetical protein